MWLNKYSGLLCGNDDFVVQRLARPYKLSLLGHVVVLDKSNSEVHRKHLQLLKHVEWIKLYSRGSACLAVLYRALDHASRRRTQDICGNLVFLQGWACLMLPF